MWILGFMGSQSFIYLTRNHSHMKLLIFGASGHTGRELVRQDSRSCSRHAACTPVAGAA